MGFSVLANMRWSQTHPGGGQGPKDCIPDGACCRGEREPELRHSSHQRVLGRAGLHEHGGAVGGEPALEALMNGVVSERTKNLSKEAAEAQLRIRL
eukprot:7424945-Pyramimonas_sp.AAC.1